MSETLAATTAVVTVSYNSGRHLRSFLSSIRSAETEPITIVVADNGSTDIEEARATCAEFSARLLELGENLGYGGAVNRAVAGLAPDITRVLVSNPDVAFAPGAITAMAEALVAHENAGAVGPRVLNDDGTVYPSARSLPSLRAGTGHALLSRVWPANPWTARYLSDTTTFDEARTTGWLSGACLMVRRDVFEQLEGFDDGFFMYFEDVDLGYRLGKAGWTSWYIPDSVVTHTGAHSTSGESQRMVRAHHESAYRYLSRKYRGWYLAPLRWSLRAGLGFRSWWLTRGR